MVPTDEDTTQIDVPRSRSQCKMTLIFFVHKPLNWPYLIFSTSFLIFIISFFFIDNISLYHVVKLLGGSLQYIWLVFMTLRKIS